MATMSISYSRQVHSKVTIQLLTWPLQDQSITTLTSNLVAVSEKYPQYSTLQQSTKAVVETFSVLMKNFGKCHRGYNSSKYMDDSEIDQLGMSRKM